ncbi:TetR/AcrR family transcriptional regulator [Frankia sp. AgB1.9]|uniref:TetR/AcrR family transcriptional regulator n=1 Tax=unclassified Frankia TaxID=2632575 RepID=UPI0019337487|nr:MULTISPECIES: TetR/AcrR family transcriptional regulator [unclassified Frankia]MBL7493358.1 TetR/AcrR family transcriptional regulator [Frankia sp. AgW1.1]MBL7552904.1 TetR/AcrR family transcriptional regulator [Frankia sp. AgB1.9]MBL7621069.1 TetR/AcrR family transcriptional regulator [Frankia sp. AgB1.8]
MATEAVNERGTGEQAEAGGDETAGRRRYDSPLRRQQAAQTRERILTAGSELVHEFTTWDWRGLTFRAVAERAGVGERTVYRYFATERELHDAIMRRLGQESGISYDDLSLDRIGDVTERLFATLPSYAIMRWDAAEPVGPTLLAEELRRREAMVEAVAAPTAEWTDEEGRMAAAMLDLLWSVPSYQRLLSAWALDGQQATRAITWAIGVLADAIRAGRRPPPAAPETPADGDQTPS